MTSPHANETISPFKTARPNSLGLRDAVHHDMARSCSWRSVSRGRFARLIRKNLPFSVLVATTAVAATWEIHPGHRLQKLPVPAQGQAGFARLNPADLQITFRNTLADADLAKKSNLMNGSGVALGDFDGDGRCDIFLPA